MLNNARYRCRKLSTAITEQFMQDRLILKKVDKNNLDLSSSNFALLASYSAAFSTNFVRDFSRMSGIENE